MADLDHLDQAALREEEQDDDDDDEDKEKEEEFYDDNDEDPRALPQQLQLQQQQDDWDDSDREEIDVPDAVTTRTTTTTKKQFDDNDEDDDRETIGLDELFASSSKSHTTTANAHAQSQLLQELHYTRLYQAWAQESRSPELLPPLDPVTLEALRKAITDVDPDDQQQNQQCDNPHMNALIQSIRHIDIQRVKFLLADLLKLRLQKIQAHPLHMRTRTDRMSEAEVEFLRDYGAAVERHWQVTVTQHFPQQVWKQLDAPDMIDAPDLDAFVLVRFLEPAELPVVGMGGKEPDFLDTGNCIVVRYRRVRDLLLEGKVELI